MKLSKIILTVLAACFCIGVGYAVADQVITSVMVPAWAECEVKDFDLVCETNAEHVIINNRKIY